MTKVLIATDKPFAPVAVKGIREIVEAQGYELALLEKYTSPEELIAAVADVDAMIIRSDKATKEVIDAAKKLKVIVRAGAGYDNIDLQACTDHGVVGAHLPRPTKRERVVARGNGHLIPVRKFIIQVVAKVQVFGPVGCCRTHKRWLPSYF